MENEFNEDFLTGIISKVSLETRLLVSNEMSFISLISDLGFRENKSWEDSEQPLLKRICELAKEHTERQLKIIKEANPSPNN